MLRVFDWLWIWLWVRVRVLLRIVVRVFVGVCFLFWVLDRVPDVDRRVFVRVFDRDWV